MNRIAAWLRKGRAAVRRRKGILAAELAVLLILGGVILSVGWNRAWSFWNIHSFSPRFFDLCPLTYGAEAYREGLDPMVRNPHDPWKRRLNYPRVWQTLYRLGLDRDDTVRLGILFVTLFFLGVAWVFTDLSPAAAGALFFLLLSPAVLLGIERGNTDLLMFFLTAGFVACLGGCPRLSFLFLMAAFILKLYPIFAGFAWFRFPRRRFLKTVAAAAVVGGIYLALNAADLQRIRAATLKSTEMTYGIRVPAMRIRTIRPGAGPMVYGLSWGLLGAGCLAAWGLVRRERSARPVAIGEKRALDAFRAGAGIYLGSFLLGCNWDYRLMFLLLTVPQLTAWAGRGDRRLARLAGAALGLVVAVAWEIVWGAYLSAWLSRYPFGFQLAFLVSQGGYWLLFFALAALSIASLPSWIVSRTPGEPSVRGECA